MTEIRDFATSGIIQSVDLEPCRQTSSLYPVALVRSETLGSVSSYMTRNDEKLIMNCKFTAFSFITLTVDRKNRFLFVFLVYFLYLYLTQIQAVFDAYTVCIFRRYKLYLPQIQTLSVRDRYCDCFFLAA